MSQRTLTILKPDSVKAGKVGSILAHLEKEGFRLVGGKKIRLSTPLALPFYEVHKDRPFYQALVSFMTEGPVWVLALERSEAVSHLRKVMGATDSKKADPGTIRNLYGTDIERNAIHGSDAPDTAAFEIAYFFNQLEIV